ncbi:MAG: Phosphonate-transporting ATPase [Phycisphaerales bacterium]|jgi:lipoprotein-releasing system ATP-binding protein|nr:Phosphonate-transporting ATPase [Phycisphaerales bacterium]MDB5354139.1 Phosphonate-transporting ATPase [Phycisphaerales bacterium]
MSQAAPKPAVSPARPEGAILRAEGLKKTYQSGEETLWVLRHVDLSLREGEFVAIEGRSGSGKSTLLHILAGLDAPDTGKVEFGGLDIAALATVVEKRRKFFARRAFALIRPFLALVDLTMLVTDTADRRLAHIRNKEFGFVFQFYHLLPEMNVLENTMLGPMIEFSTAGFRSRADELRDRAAGVLKQLGMDHRLKHKPNQLSGGERQRVAIARALMNNPKVLFADEPTGNLDADTGRQIMGVLEKLHRERGQTIVMVTHDRSLASQADRALVLRQGRLERPGDSPGADKTGAGDYH